MKKALITSGAAMLLAITGISHADASSNDERLLSFRNAQIYNGRIFAGNENEPFTGIVNDFPMTIAPIEPVKILIKEVRGVTQDTSTHHFITRDSWTAGSQRGGLIACNGGFKDGYIHGQLFCFSLSDGLPILDANYYDGQLNGPVVVYSLKDAEGSKLLEAEFVNHKVNGGLTAYGFNSSNTVFVSEWTDGVLDGMMRAFTDDENNYLTVEKELEYGEAAGVERRYDSATGELISSVYNHRWGVIENPNNIDLDACAQSWVEFYNSESEEPVLFRYDELDELRSRCAEGDIPGA